MNILRDTSRLLVQRDIKLDVALHYEMITDEELEAIYAHDMVIVGDELLNLNSSALSPGHYTGIKCKIFPGRATQLMIDKLLSQEKEND